MYQLQVCTTVHRWTCTCTVASVFNYVFNDDDDDDGDDDDDDVLTWIHHQTHN